MTVARVFFSKLRSFARLTWCERALFLVAWILLGLSRFAILTLSFRRLAPCLGVRDFYPWLPLLSRSNELRAVSIGRSVRLAAKYTPWESNCFPQALTARVLLRAYKIPYALFFGVARDGVDRGMQAHAWVAAGKVQVTGGYSFDRFTVVGCFIAPDFWRLAKNFEPSR